MGDFSKTQLSDWKTLKFDDDASAGYLHGENARDEARDSEYHSTVWVKRGNKWQALLHQGTPRGDGGGQARHEEDVRRRSQDHPRQRMG